MKNNQLNLIKHNKIDKFYDKCPKRFAFMPLNVNKNHWVSVIFDTDNKLLDPFLGSIVGPTSEREKLVYSFSIQNLFVFRKKRLFFFLY